VLTVSATVLSERARAAATRGDGEPALAVVVIGMSAGGLSGLKAIVQDLPKDFPSALVIAHHVAAPSILPKLIRGWTNHTTTLGSGGEILRNGTIYVAPAQQHVIINPDATLGILQRERVRFVRPSVDWLFESAAGSFGQRVIAVVLSGANGDGSYGARCVSRAGGTLIVQDPASCDYPQMPSSVIATGVAHRSLHASQIGSALMSELSRLENESFSWYPFGDERLEAVAPSPS
jgi:two-component system chemotaxis response regulator CheB